MRYILVCITLVALAVTTRAGELRIAAAADMKFAMDEIVKEIRILDKNADIKVTYGSSGNFFAQLQNRARFDLYFSADVAYPRKLADAGLALDTNVYVYGVGRIVLWSAKVDVSKGMKVLTNSEVKKVAIANPQHAPYGKAAVAAMKAAGVYEAAEPKLVFGENISQAAQFVASGAADVGIIAASLALSREMVEAGKLFDIPMESYPRLEQGVIIMKWTKEEEAARGFLEFVKSARGREVLRRFGFYVGS